MSSDEAIRRLTDWFEAAPSAPQGKMEKCSVEDITTNAICARLGARVVRAGMGRQGYLITERAIIPLGRSFGGSGLQSLCVADLDQNGIPELYYITAWGSGMHRYDFGMWSRVLSKPETVEADMIYLGFEDLALEPRDGDSVLVLADKQVFARLRLETERGMPYLSVELDPSLPENVREKWDPGAGHDSKADEQNKEAEPEA